MGYQGRANIAEVGWIVSVPLNYRIAVKFGQRMEVLTCALQAFAKVYFGTPSQAVQLIQIDMITDIIPVSIFYE